MTFVGHGGRLGVVHVHIYLLGFMSIIVWNKIHCPRSGFSAIRFQRPSFLSSSK